MPKVKLGGSTREEQELVGTTIKVDGTTAYVAGPVPNTKVFAAITTNAKVVKVPKSQVVFKKQFLKQQQQQTEQKNNDKQQEQLQNKNKNKKKTTTQPQKKGANWAINAKHLVYRKYNKGGTTTTRKSKLKKAHPCLDRGGQRRHSRGQTPETAYGQKPSHLILGDNRGTKKVQQTQTVKGDRGRKHGKEGEDQNSPSVDVVPMWNCDLAKRDGVG